jgi:hypothetical protein
MLLLQSFDALAAPRLSAKTSRASTSTFPLGEQIEIFFSVDDPNPQTQKLILEIKNEYGNRIAGPLSVDLEEDEDGTTSYTYRAPSQKFGYYEVHARLSDGTTIPAEGSRPAGFVTYAIVPDPASRVDYGDKLSRFGLQGGFNRSALVIPYLGVRYILGGNDWARMEPDHPGQFLEDRYKADRAGKKHPAPNSSVEGLIFNGRPWNTYSVSLIASASLPPWALKPGTAGAKCPKFGELNEEGFKALPVFALAQSKAFAKDHKNQSGRFYQVTWEPVFSWGYGGSPEALVKMYEKAYTAIHQGDPGAIVAGPTLHNHHTEVAQLYDLLAHGLGKYIDALSFHPYPVKWPSEKHGMPNIVREQVAAATKARGKPVRFIGTEQGHATPDVTLLEKAMGDIRTTLMMLGEGADLDFGFYVADEGTTGRLHGYYWNLNPKIRFGTDKLGPKSIVPAYAAMTYFIDGTKSSGVLKNTEGTQLGYRFKRDRKTIDVAWDYDQTSMYRVPPNVKVYNWMGNPEKTEKNTVTLSGAPVYIIGDDTAFQ